MFYLARFPRHQLSTFRYGRTRWTLDETTRHDPYPRYYQELVPEPAYTRVYGPKGPLTFPTLHAAHEACAQRQRRHPEYRFAVLNAAGEEVTLEGYQGVDFKEADPWTS